MFKKANMENLIEGKKQACECFHLGGSGKYPTKRAVSFKDLQGGMTWHVQAVEIKVIRLVVE